MERRRDVLESLAPVVPPAAREALDLEHALAAQAAQVEAAREAFAAQQDKSAALAQKLEAEQAALAESLQKLPALSRDERGALLDHCATRAGELVEAARALRRDAQAAEAPIPALQARHAEYYQRWQALRRDAPQEAQLRQMLELLLNEIDNHRLVAYALHESASAHRRLARDYEAAADDIRRYGRRFWIRNAWLLDVGRVLLTATLAHLGLSLLGWLVVRAVGLAGRGKRTAVLPTVKRVQTLVTFARSIGKLLIWLVAAVTILAVFGIQPGQSAGALGVIGLVLAGMFQQIVVDFVKGIDIAVGGHYFVGDFIAVTGHSGHVLDFRVKYTILRTPSGQVVTLPNSQCIPSRRFPSGFVDNYVDVPLVARGDLSRARQTLREIGALLNARIEAVKRRPDEVAVFERSDGGITIRMQVRVLPTCDWVLKDHYLPMVKEALATAEIPLLKDPDQFFLNDIPTFRRLFSRQMSDREMAETLRADMRPTLQREEIPDPAAPPPPAGGR